MMVKHNPYLIALNIAGKNCLVVGGGKVATRKVDALLASGAIVTVISPVINETLATYAEDSRIARVDAVYKSELMAGLHPVLVIAATDDTRINQQVAEDAGAIGALLNDVSETEHSDFFNMATIQRDNIQVGISSGGASPALVRYLKAELLKVVDEAFGILSTWLNDLRSKVSESIEHEEDRLALYQAILESDVLALLRDGQLESAQGKFDAIIAEHLS